jgi:hypothetical protein
MTALRFGMIAVAALALAGAASPALAQDADSDSIQTVPSDPLSLFKAVCVNGIAKLSRKEAEPMTYSALPDPARHALGASGAADAAEAARAPIPVEAAVTTRMFRMNALNVFLLVPAKEQADAGPLAESCIVLWRGSDQDYLDARKIVLPDEDEVPLYQRPQSRPNGALFVTKVGGGATVTLATYGGWIALRSFADPAKAN